MEDNADQNEAFVGHDDDDGDDELEEGEALDLLFENLVDIFANNPEVWVERQLQIDNSNGNNNSNSNASDNASDAASLKDLHENDILRIASYLEAPQDMTDFFQTCCATWIASTRGTGGYALLLNSVLRYFSVLKVYADSVEPTVEGGWPTMVTFLTTVARELQTKVYGPHWEVHPMHRALIAEVILEQLCGVRCWDLVPSAPQQQQQQQQPRVRPSMDLCNTWRYKHSLLNYQVLFGDLERSFRDMNDYGPRYLREWLQQTQDAINTNTNNNNNINPQNMNNLNTVQRRRIQDGLLHLIWIFRDDSGQPIESAIGFGGPQDDDQMEISSWSSHVDDDTIAKISPGRPFWNRDQDCDARYHLDDKIVRSVVDLFCLGMGSDGCNGMEFVLGRLAWAVAHKIHPALSHLEVSSWEALIQDAAQELDELQDWERSLALAAIRRQIPLAVSTDYL